MSLSGQGLLHIASGAALALLIVSVALSFIRMVRGPKAADRVVALDLIGVLIIAFLAAYAVHVGDASFLDVALAYALVAFLGTLALSRLLMRSARRPHDDPDRRGRP